MDETRLAGIEARNKDGRAYENDVAELLAEVRRRGELVDRLLEDWPWRRTTQGRICPACQSFENYCDCSRKQVSDARDWEVTDEEDAETDSPAG
jgi:hypothetical protein